MEKYRRVLKCIEKKHAKSLSNRYGLICKQMQYGDEDAALYIAKKNWTNRFDMDRETTVGIFFCAWVSPELLEDDNFAYNIHSLKLRELPGYNLASREFANNFRTNVESRVVSWPNIRMDYGPLTLLEGRDLCEIDTFDKKVENRISDFVEIHEEIDKLLQTVVR